MTVYEPADDVDAAELSPSAVRVVFRLVTTDDSGDESLIECFRSNAERGRPPRGREKQQPSVHRGLSVFATRAQVLDRQRRIVAALRLAPGEAPRIGTCVATLTLRGPGVWHTTPEVDGHLTIWASPTACMASVTAIDAIR